MRQAECAVLLVGSSEQQGEQLMQSADLCWPCPPYAIQTESIHRQLALIAVTGCDGDRAAQAAGNVAGLHPPEHAMRRVHQIKVLHRSTGCPPATPDYRDARSKQRDEVSAHAAGSDLLHGAHNNFSCLRCRSFPAELHGACAVNSVVEYNAARVLQAAYAAGLRHEVEQRRARRAGAKRRHSADFSRPALHSACIGRHSFDVRPLSAACVQQGDWTAFAGFAQLVLFRQVACCCKG